MNPATCAAHSDSLARIEEKLESIDARFARLNGSVARHEEAIISINLKAAEEKGRRGGVNMVAVWAVTMLGLVFAGWQSHSAQQQTNAALASIQATQTTQSQR